MTFLTARDVSLPNQMSVRLAGPPFNVKICSAAPYLLLGFRKGMGGPVVLKGGGSRELT